VAKPKLCTLAGSVVAGVVALVLFHLSYDAIVMATGTEIAVTWLEWFSGLSFVGGVASAIGCGVSGTSFFYQLCEG
jgi:hypothetical protein